MPIYRISVDHGSDRLVEAPSRLSALLHVLGDRISVGVVSATSLVTYMRAGHTIEVAGAVEGTEEETIVAAGDAHE